MKECSIMTRIKIIKPILEKKTTQKALTESLGIGKNTINNTMKLYYENETPEQREYILNSHTYDYDFLRSKFEYLGYKDRAPKSHSRSIKPEKALLVGKYELFIRIRTRDTGIGILFLKESYEMIM